MTDHRSAITGQYVTAEHAKTNPDTTVSEQRTRRPASNYSELRKLAEACPPEDTNSRWYSEDQLAQAIELAPVIVDEDRPFVAACSPTVVLGLLDELDRLGSVVHTQRVAIDGYREEVERLRADLPIVRTVGDLTPRHIGRRVRIVDPLDGDSEGEVVGIDFELDFITVWLDQGTAVGCTLDTPCEVLP